MYPTLHASAIGIGIAIPIQFALSRISDIATEQKQKARTQVSRYGNWTRACVALRFKSAMHQVLLKHFSSYLFTYLYGPVTVQHCELSVDVTVK